jgi:hypothetical protein
MTKKGQAVSGIIGVVVRGSRSVSDVGMIIV